VVGPLPRARIHSKHPFIIAHQLKFINQYSSSILYYVPYSTTSIIHRPHHSPIIHHQPTFSVIIDHSTLCHYDPSFNIRSITRRRVMPSRHFVINNLIYHHRPIIIYHRLPPSSFLHHHPPSSIRHYRFPASLKLLIISYS
jgi:hypothetical protein